ncbi:MAG TPA: dephospho-CoA kinase [Sphingomicrobium sp.]|nr:dephospho-CoA kinase [Sphingomicrobium sp.]
MSLKVALTGSIGMGKSTVGKMFAERGVPLFEADAAVHRLYRSGPLVGKIERRFPGSTGPQGVDRIKLSRALMAKGEDVSAVEAIVHPAVRAERDKFIAEHRGSPILLFDIPLLFETGGETDFDATIVVTAPLEVQRRRVLARAGMRPQFLDIILERQMPDADKRERADFIIDNGSNLPATEAQVEHILACLKERVGR